jgi:hypothetical protein
MSMLLHLVDTLAQQMPLADPQIPVPNPPPKPLPGQLGDRLNDVISWAKTIALALAVLGTLAVAAMLFIGLRGRSDTAKNALGHLPFVVLGVVLTGGAAALIQAFQ